MEKNPKTETISDPQFRTTPHLTMGSSPESPTKSDTSSTESEPPSPPAKSPAESPVHLTLGSIPESPSESNATRKPPSSPARSPAGSPVHLTLGSTPESPSESNTIRKPPSSPARSPAGSPVHLTIGSTSESPSKSSTNSSRPNSPSPPTRSPAGSPVHLTIGSSPESPSRINSVRSQSKPHSLPTRSPADSPARSSVSSDHTTPTHGSSPREEKAPASPPEKPPGGPPEKFLAPVVTRSVHEEPMALTKLDPSGGEYGMVEENGGIRGGGMGGSGRRTRPPLSILRGVKRKNMVKRAALGFRVFGALFCLVSFSVMAANRNMGWALDSFYRYKEFRYFMSMNVIGFVYSAAQAFDLAYHSATGKYAVQHPYRYYFVFAIDQMITYLLISASSSATTRIDDWKSNWGKDKFPDLATASVSIAYLAFVALAFSSLISGYALCTSKSMQL